MFNRIPADVSEIVVVYTRCYDVYREMKYIVKKFEEKCVEERILDKLTIKTDITHYISYKIETSWYRSYDKPCYVGVKCYNVYYVYQWARPMRRCKKLNMPFAITFEGDRFYEKRAIREKISGSIIYIFGDLVIYKSGLRKNLNRSIRSIISL